jgi:hypothetical protein
LPGRALLTAYVARGYTDCLTAEVAGRVTLGEYITAFYSSLAFRPEQVLLRLIGKPSNRADAIALAAGAERFAAWTVEARGDDQILLCDFTGRTRSWLMVEQVAGGTRLYFGSAVVRQGGAAERGTFKALLWFHKLYARTLLRSAARALRG